MLKFTSFLLSSAETLFVYIVDPDNMKSIMDNNAIYTTWRTVRDVFNIAFIMVLLFSAFCTIFQYSKYGIKTIWRNLVLMALLVNFSYPIARFIIDASNMLMYGFLNNLGGTNSFLVLIEQSGLSKIIGTDSPDPLYLLSAVVFTFIFAITLLTIAILLVIRTITLAIYIIFSPIAFTGSILPGTALASSASSWWTDFMKQCFAGPIIIFFLYIANKMMLAVSSSQDGLKNIAVKQVPGGVPVGSIEGLADLIAAASFFALPIIILWYGIIMAQKSGIAGAEMAVGYGKKAMKWGSGLTFADNTWKAYQSRRAKAKEDSWANKLGSWVGSKQDQARSALLPGGKDARLRYEADQLAKIKKEGERSDMPNMSTNELRDLAANSRNKHTKAAAIRELAERGQATKADLDIVRSAFGETSQAFKQLSSKVKSFDPVAAFSHIKDDTDRMTRLREFVNSNQFDAKKINSNSLGNDELMEIMLANNAISTKDMLDISKTSPDKKNAIKKSIAKLADEKDFADDEVSQKVQMSHFALTGEISKEITRDANGNIIVDTTTGKPVRGADRSDFAQHIFSNIGDETIQNITTDTATNYSEHMARYTKNYKKTLQGIKDDTAKRIINKATQEMDDMAIAALPVKEKDNAESAKKIASKDPQLRNIK